MAGDVLPFQGAPSPSQPFPFHDLALFDAYTLVRRRVVVRPYCRDFDAERWLLLTAAGRGEEVPGTGGRCNVDVFPCGCGRGTYATYGGGGGGSQQR